MATGATLATAGDAIAQAQTAEPYDKRRAASFMVSDMAYRLQHAAFPIVVHEFRGQYLGSLLLILTAFVQGLRREGAIERAKEMFVPLMKRNLLFWIPVQFVQFGCIDEQIPFLSVAGLCWTFILSVAAGSAKSYSDDQATATQQLTAQQMPLIDEASDAETVYVSVPENLITVN